MKSLKAVSNLLPIPSYTAIILCFFFPFFLIRCEDTTLLSVKGTDLITGVSKKNIDRRMKESIKKDSVFGSMAGDHKKDSSSTENEYAPLNKNKKEAKENGGISPNPFIIIALLAAISGIGIQIIKKIRRKHIYHIIFSLIGFFSLWSFYLSFQSEMKNLGESKLTMGMKLGISYEFGIAFYLCGLLFLLPPIFYGISNKTTS